MKKESYDVAVVGAGVGGVFAAAAAKHSNPYLDVGVFERKSREKAGHIACGDAYKAPEEELPGEALDVDRIVENSRIGMDNDIDFIKWIDARQPGVDIRKKLPYGKKSSSVFDRYEFGQEIIRQAEELGVDFHFDTVVNGFEYDEEAVVEGSNYGGRFEGVYAVENGDEVFFDSDVTIDAGGAMSRLTDEFVSQHGDDLMIDPSKMQHNGSAYREIIETEEPVPFENSIVGRPILEGDVFGYLWDFPRSGTETNVGLGFQMSNPEGAPMVEITRKYLEQSEDYVNPKVQEKFDGENKLGSALALRRPRDSLVAPGFMLAGGNACFTHPMTGKGIHGSAVSGNFAGIKAAQAASEGDLSLENLWDYNYHMMVEDGLGADIASRDPFNVAAGGIENDVLRGGIALLPEEEISNVVGTEGGRSLEDQLQLARGVARNYLKHKREGTFHALGVSEAELVNALTQFGIAKHYSMKIEDWYREFPEDPDDFWSWKMRRDEIDNFHQSLLEEQKYGNSRNGMDPVFIKAVLDGNLEEMGDNSFEAAGRIAGKGVQELLGYGTYGPQSN